MHMRMPRFKDAQSGSGLPQSAHLSFPLTLLRTSIGFSVLIVCVCKCILLDERKCLLRVGLSNADFAFKA